MECTLSRFGDDMELGKWLIYLKVGGLDDTPGGVAVLPFSRNLRGWRIGQKET